MFCITKKKRHKVITKAVLNATVYKNCNQQKKNVQLYMYTGHVHP